MKRKAFDALTARTGGNLMLCGMRRERLCLQFISGMSHFVCYEELCGSSFDCCSR